MESTSPAGSNPRDFTNRFGTALISDAAYRAGVPVRVAPPALRPVDRERNLAGPVRTVEANNDLVSIIAALHACEAGDVLVIANGATRTKEVALMGDLIGAEAARRKIGGAVVDACVRDAASLRRLGLPVFSRGLYPIGPLKLPAAEKGLGRTGTPVALGGVTVSPGDWAFGDEDGVVFLAGPDLDAVARQAGASLEREKGLMKEIEGGHPLGDVLGIEDFLKAREADPRADFNAHLARIGRAI